MIRPVNLCVLLQPIFIQLTMPEFFCSRDDCGPAESQQASSAFDVRPWD